MPNRTSSPMSEHKDVSFVAGFIYGLEEHFKIKQFTIFSFSVQVTSNN